MAAVNAARDENRSLRIDAPFVLAKTVAVDRPFVSGAIEMRDAPDVQAYWLGELRRNSDGGGPFEFSAPVRIANLVVDMGRPETLDRLAKDVAIAQPAISIFGSLKMDAPEAIDGVVVERAVVRNGRSRAAIAIANCRGLTAGSLIVESNWGAAVLMSGLQDSHIETIEGRDVGDLGPEASRYGQVAAIYCESDPAKRPARWYEIADRQHPVRNMLPISGLDIGHIKAERNTDTAVYIHDYPGGREGAGAGVNDVRIGSVEGTDIGKDLLKVRLEAGRIMVGAVNGRRIGARGVAIEDGAHDVVINSVAVEDVGIDVLAALLGRPTFLDRERGGRGATLTTSAIGVDVSHGGDRRVGATRNITINNASVNHVSLRPDHGDQGWGVRIENAQDVHVRAVVRETGGGGAYVSGARNFTLDVEVHDALRARSRSLDRDYAIFVTASHGGRIDYAVTESSSKPRMPYAFRATGDCSNIDISGVADAKMFMRLGFGHQAEVLIGTPASVRFRHGKP